jgi:hypothetical protein
MPQKDISATATPKQQPSMPAGNSALMMNPQQFQVAESPTGLIMDEYDEQEEKEYAPTNKFQPIYKRQAKPNYLQNLK